MTLLLSSTFAVATIAGPLTTYADHSQCSDGIDNDNNTRIDYPQDPGCTSIDDNNEGITAAGVFITITDDKDKITPGGALVYAITINQQRDDTKLVNVDLHLPAEANLVSASDGGNFTGGDIRWTNLNVNKNSPRRLTVHVNVSPTAPHGLYLVARASVLGADAAQATDTTLIDNTIGAPANTRFFVTLTDHRDNILPGDSLYYTATVRNDGAVPTRTDVRVTMPEQTEYIASDVGSTHDLHNIIWRNVSLDPGQTNTFNFTVRLEQRVPDRTRLRARVTVDGNTATDETSVRVGLPDNAITASITDNQSTAGIGDLLTYVIVVRNSSPVIGSNVSVDAAIPLYGEFVSATEGGRWDGANVRWLRLPIAPNGSRELHYTVRVRSDAPNGATLIGSVSADNYVDRDATLVSDGSMGASTRNAGGNQRFVFRKTSDTGEIMPGGKIRYTLFVRNTLATTVSDAVISDRFDSTYLRLESFEDGKQLIGRSAGTLDWRVPVLQPGESWQTSYVLSVSNALPKGLQLNNIATISGRDLHSVSLTQKVSTMAVGTEFNYPTTGAGMGELGALLLSGLGFASAFGQRRKWLTKILG